MQSNQRYSTRLTVLAVMTLLVAGLAMPEAYPKKLKKKQWRITITAPDSPTGNHFGTRTFVIKARNYDEPPSPLPLRKLTATLDGDDVQLQGVWRQEGKDFSLTFELLCGQGAACATVILRGRFRSATEMSGRAILMWDTRDRQTAAGFETVNGTFEGIQQ